MKAMALEQAFPSFYRELRDSPHAKDAELRRLLLSKEGKLQAELRMHGHAVWVRWNGKGLRALVPDDDHRLPAARLLREDGVELISYRPRRRLVMLDRRSAQPRVIKAFRANRFEGVFRNHQVAHQALSGKGIRPPQILDSDPDMACLVMARDEGTALLASSELQDEFHLFGECLAEFQDHTDCVPLPAHGADDELDILDGQADRHELSGLAPGDDWRNLRDRLRLARDGLPEPKLGLCHRDLYDKQVIHHAHRLTLIDFDLLCYADIALDPANFLAHLRLRELQSVRGATMKGTHVCGKRLLDGWGRHRSPGFWERLRFYQATTFARLALLYALRPAWDRLPPQLTTLGHRCLDDLRRVRNHR